MLLGERLDVAPPRSHPTLSPLVGGQHRTAATQRPRRVQPNFLITAGHSRNGVYLSHKRFAGNRYSQENLHAISSSAANPSKHATSPSKLQKMSVPDGRPGPCQPSRLRSCWTVEMNGKSSMGLEESLLYEKTRRIGKLPRKSCAEGTLRCNMRILRNLP